ncbi:uncharacterized protein LOC143548675 [Bidens hawaiensis]|uniref:uncharacterized protein LOC143548675 n=1 Tax=Bidens hawaiensis TaxID=980011 RepID=UPI004049E3E5
MANVEIFGFTFEPQLATFLAGLSKPLDIPMLARKMIVRFPEMKLNLTFFVALFIISVVVHSVNADPEVKKNTLDGVGLDTKIKPDPKASVNVKSSKSNLESNQADPGALKNDKVSNDVKNVNVDNTKSVSSKQLGVTAANNVHKGSKDKDLVDKGEMKTKTDEGSKDGPKEENLRSMRKGSFRGELCDSSFKCTIGNGGDHEMIACLSVPGDESTLVSLLIQNKGKGPLDVDISAPDFVHLDKTKVQFRENDDEKVMVSIGDGKTEKLITLKTHEGSCSLDFMDFLTHNPIKKSNNVSQSTYTNFYKRTPLLGVLSLALMLVIVSVVVCVTYQKRWFVNSGMKYQKLDAEIPVSGGPKVDFDQKDGWDDTWSDDWGDVEAPSTPSMPLTPSISSAGVSSRRINKDAWKD